MNRWQFKLFDLPPADLDVALNNEGQFGWYPLHPIGTPQGMKFLMARQTDEPVTATDLETEKKIAKEAELAARFGLGAAAPNVPGLGPGLLIK